MMLISTIRMVGFMLNILAFSPRIIITITNTLQPKMLCRISIYVNFLADFSIGKGDLNL